MSNTILILSAVIGTTIAYNCSKKVRYHVKFGFFTFGVLIVTLPFIPFMIFRPRDYRNVFMPSTCCILLGRLYGLKFELRGLENIDKKKGGVMISNHQSGLDILVCCHLSLTVGRFAAVVKKSVFYVFPYAWLWGTIFLDRASKQAGRNFISNESKEIEEKQTKIFMYPEGTRNEGTEMLPFKKGAFHIALNSQCDIIPVVTSRYYFIDSKTYKFDGGRSIIEILPPISTKGMDKSEIDVLMKSTWYIMQKKYEELTAEVLKMKKFSAE